MNKLKAFAKKINYTKLLIASVPSIICFCILSSIFIIKEGEIVTLSTLGKISYISDPGIHFKFPYPIQEINNTNINKINTMEINFSESGKGKKLKLSNKEGAILTSDKNLITLNVTVDWKINDIHSFLLNFKEPEEIYRNSIISSVTSIIRNYSLESIKEIDKFKLESILKHEVENIVSKYNLGIETINIRISEPLPPEEVLEAIETSTNIRDERELLITKAIKYRDEKIASAEAEAKRIAKESEANSEEIINKARCETIKFNSLYEEYKKKRITKNHILIDTLEEILPEINLYIIDDKSEMIKSIFKNK